MLDDDKELVILVGCPMTIPKSNENFSNPEC